MATFGGLLGLIFSGYVSLASQNCRLCSARSMAVLSDAVVITATTLAPDQNPLLRSRETSGNVAKCRLFSQAFYKSIYNIPHQMFDLLPLAYSFTKPYIATFFHPFYTKRREKTFLFFFHAYQICVRVSGYLSSFVARI